MSFKNLLDEGLGQYLKKWDGQAMAATFKNGSQILFMAESFDVDKDLNKFRGLEISGAGIDEVNEIQEATFNKIIERAGSWTKGGAPPKILATCNPTLGWVKPRFYDAYKEGKLPKGWAYIPAKLTDNPHLSPEYVESLRNNMPPYEYEVYVNGNWDVLLKTGSEFYHAFSYMDNTSDLVEYNPALPLWLSFDENVNPYLTCIIGQGVGKQAFIIDEITAEHPKNNVAGICQIIRDRYNNHVNGMFITGDATSKKQDAKIEKGFDFFKLVERELAMFRPVKRVPSANPSIYMRGQFINAVFSINYNGINIVIAKKCKKLCEDLMQIRQAEDGTKHKETFVNEFGVRCERLGHCSDGMDYLIIEIFKADFSDYQRPGFRTKPILGVKSYNKETGY